MPAESGHRSDLETFMGTLASRLRVQARALRGVAALEGERGSTDDRATLESVSDLEDVAEQLDRLRSTLCQRCRMIEVTEETSVEGA